MKFVTGKDRSLPETMLVTYKAGEIIFRDGELGTEMYIIQKGKVEVRKQIGAEIRVISVMEKGDFFGEMAILEGMSRSATAVAAEETECIAINEATFDQMLQQNQEIAIRMLRRLSKKLRETTELLDQVAAKTVQVTQAAALIEKKLAPAPATAISPYTLILIEDPEKTFLVKAEGATLVGRKDPVTEIYPDVDLGAVDTNRSISRRHAKITVTGREVFLQEEIGTTNGTFLNGERLKKGEYYSVHDGDEVQFGLVRCTFKSAK
jgi:hypothetical protein